MKQIQLPYTRTLNGVTEIMVPLSDHSGFVNARVAINLGLPIDGKIFHSVGELQQYLLDQEMANA